MSSSRRRDPCGRRIGGYGRAFDAPSSRSSRVVPETVMVLGAPCDSTLTAVAAGIVHKSVSGCTWRAGSASKEEMIFVLGDWAPAH